jgi:class 3 adenylate cyclase
VPRRSCENVVVSGEGLPRGTVTFLFSDVEDSTELVRRFGNDVFAAIRGDHRRLLRTAFSEHGGHEIDTAGDGFFVVFDSAKSAVAAAVAAQRALAAFGWPRGADVRIRIGLHTAEPHIGDEGYVGIGVHRAARICDAARGGQILVSNATAGIVEDAELQEVELLDLGEYQLKGLLRRQRLFQLSVHGLRSDFEPPRTPDVATRRPGVGTFLASDLTRWRHVIRGLGDEASEGLLGDYHATVTVAVETNDGAVLERVGDHALAVFGDAANALRAAGTLREALAEFTVPAEFGVGIAIVVHSGRWSGDPQQPKASTALYRLHLLAQLAEPGQVLVSQATAALLEGDRSSPPLRDLGEREIPDSDKPAPVYELAGPQ